MVNSLNVGIHQQQREEHMATAHQIHYLYGSFSLLLIILFGLVAWGMIALV
jgi:hypothetical protein